MQARPSSTAFVRVAAAFALAALASGCGVDGDPSWGGAASEGVLALLLTLVTVVAVGIGVALLLLAVVALLLAASGVLIAWNLVRPHWVGRVLGLTTGALDVLAGAGVLAMLLWLSVDTRGGHLEIHLDGGGFLAMTGFVLLVLGPATMIAALVPRRAEPPKTQAPDAPALTPP